MQIINLVSQTKTLREKLQYDPIRPSSLSMYIVNNMYYVMVCWALTRSSKIKLIQPEAAEFSHRAGIVQPLFFYCFSIVQPLFFSAPAASATPGHC